MTLTAQLFPVWSADLASYTDKYNVTFASEIIVERSRDPETDLARALVARSHTGTVTMLDGATGKPRTTIDIQRAAKANRGRSAWSPLRKVARDRSGAPADG
jgi:hypothetical protein